jgi:hypothetical protein
LASLIVLMDITIVSVDQTLRLLAGVGFNRALY